MVAHSLRALARTILALIVPSTPEKTNVEVDSENKVSLQLGQSHTAIPAA
jgi:hypothetical protein